jgi:hypothetical protein
VVVDVFFILCADDEHEEKGTGTPAFVWRLVDRFGKDDDAYLRFIDWWDFDDLETTPRYVC